MCILARVSIVHDSLNDIAGRQNLSAVGSAEDTVDLDCRFRRHVDHSSACIALVVAASIDRTYIAVQQVDDS